MRLLFLVAGGCFLLLGIVGAVLPVLPTTPFILLAAGCFARSSERTHQWLVANRLFGPLIQQWHRSRTIPLRAKMVATFMIVLSLTGSALMVSSTPLHLLAFGLLGCALLGAIWRYA